MQQEPQPHSNVPPNQSNSSKTRQVKSIESEHLIASISRKEDADYLVSFHYLKPVEEQNAGALLRIRSDYLQELSRLAAVADGWVAFDRKRSHLTEPGIS